MKTGCMPNTDFCYEEFEGLLGSFYLTLLPLKDSQYAGDSEDFEKALSILNRFAERHDVQKPEDAIAHPRSAAKPKAFDACLSLNGRICSFWRDFGVGAEPDTLDFSERIKLHCLLLCILHRHGVVWARFKKLAGGEVVVNIEDWNREKQFRPLAEVLSS